MDAMTPPETRREAGKSERRRLIVKAAAALVREMGFDAVSMTQIAERAGVAPATLYNLFQTKSAIYGQVFDLDLEAFQQRLAEVASRDSLERIFAALDLAASLYQRDPDFYRAMARGGGDDVRQLGSAISAPREAFWQALVAEAMGDGGLRPDANSELLGTMLSQLMGGIFLHWVVGNISAERLAKEAAYGFAMGLLAYAADAAAPALTARLKALQSELATSGRK
jgi:AcrR family transcriptional regulator